MYIALYNIYIYTGMVRVLCPARVYDNEKECARASKRGRNAFVI